MNFKNITFLFSVIVVLFVWGCEAKIGDDCSTDSDCSSSGGRTCDKTLPGGYCTIKNCSRGDCPEGSRCIAFYPNWVVSEECDPATEDNLELADPTNDCSQDEVCLTSGYCAPLMFETRYCMQKCSSGGDCRDKYECISTEGVNYTLMPDSEHTYSNVLQTKFCSSN
ncbi:MAG: hypothetical protein ACQES9_12450 [Myxococcota bacterium]